MRYSSLGFVAVSLLVAPAVAFQQPLISSSLVGRRFPPSPRQALQGRILRHIWTPPSDVSSTIATAGCGVSRSTTTSLCVTPNQLALTVGSCGLLAQLGLSKLLDWLNPDDQHPGVMAHSLVALMFLITITVMGAQGWAAATAAPIATSLLTKSSASAATLAAAVAGMMALWDVPTTMWIRRLRKPDVIIHHIIMTVVAYCGAVSLPTPYVFFYLGLSELSSIPLVLHDQLVTSHKQRQPSSSSWSSSSSSSKKPKGGNDGSPTSVLVDMGEGKDDSTSTTSTSPSTVLSSRLLPLLQAATAVSFVGVRVVWFCKVTLLRFVPDVWRTLSSTVIPDQQRPVLWFLLVSSFGFTFLQLYWFYTQILFVLWNKTAN